MCGIGGVFAFDSAAPVDLSVLQRMCESLQHRGPDDDGIFIEEEGRIGLAHRRLSIIDLATGHQPMSNEAQTLWIVYNGEIYNSPELRRQLQRAGYRFATTSDTEVIIHLYDSMGEPAFTRLNGMFAFALYDRRNQTLVLARDIFGVKPLYYMVHEGRLLFGSEIKAILADRSVPRALDHEALDTFLTLRYSPSPQTLFKGIRKLPPGHLLRVTRSGSVTVEPYNLERPALDECISEAEATEEYDRLLGQAVERQLLADVPVGLLLSGGVDSAMLGYLMQRASSDTLKTFSIGFEGRGDYNELRDARETAEFIGADHHETTLTKTEYLAFYPRSFYYTEEPIAETTVPALWYVARLAASHLKVVLAGQGPDELLAGYRRYLGARYLNTFGPLIGNTPARALISLLPRNAALKRAAHAASFSDEFRRLYGILTIFTEEQKRELMNDATRERARDSSEALLETLYSHTERLPDALSKLLYIDTRALLPDDILLFNDKMTMGNSLEMRVPYLDVDLVRFVESLPVHFKLRGTTGKYVHKRVAERWLPKRIVHRKKRGFTTPMDEWLQSGLAHEALRLLEESGSACEEYFDLDYVRGMVAAHQAKRENYQVHLFALMSFELWHRTFFDNLPLPEVLDPAAAAGP